MSNSANNLHNSDKIDDHSLVHLAQLDRSFEDISSKELAELKSALIIHSDTSEPAHFMQCVEERLCYFVRNPTLLEAGINTQPFNRWRKFLSDNHQNGIFKKVDRVNETSFCNLTLMAMRNFLKGYDIVFFTLFAGTFDGYDSMVRSVIDELIDSGELSIVFLRGNSLPQKLGFLNESSIPYAHGSHIQLLLKNINQLDGMSLFLNWCLEKLVTITRSETEKVDNCLELVGSFVFGISEKVLNLDDWHILAKAYNAQETATWIIHKKKKVMFTPWYGFSHGNENSCVLCLCSLRYLLNDHLKNINNSKIFKSNLWNKAITCKLSDISIQVIPSV